MGLTALSKQPAAQVIYRPQGKTIREFHTSEAFFRVLIGPLGSGKTQACIFELLHCIDNQVPDRNGKRRSRWLAARNTYPDLQTTTITDYRAFTDQIPGFEFKNGSPPISIINYPRQDGTVVEAEVLFEAFDRASDDRKGRGKQLTGVWFNELKELNKANVDMLASQWSRSGAFVSPMI